jgi:enamine deaminase RidA (YjgF/YER057c/UK114 family)
MSVEPLNPNDLGPASGFSHGMLGGEGGRVLFVAGQIGVVNEAASVSGSGSGSGSEPAGAEAPLISQFGEALRRLLRVVEAGGGRPHDIGRMTVFVTDMELYRRSRKALGVAFKAHMGSHYPAMALVEVKSLVDPRALVEIEATAVVGGR